MSKLQKQNIIVIVGPTASGKSELAVRLAKKINGEIVSADSRQVYRGLNIGTAKITKKDMGGIKHYCLDITDPKNPFTAHDFRKAADSAIIKIRNKGKTPILVGGSGFYIDTTIYRSNSMDIPPNWKLRKKLDNAPAETLYKNLKKLDPRRANNIDPKNKRRLIRALEIVKALGKVPKLKKTPRYGTVIIGLNPPARDLKRGISHRVDNMLRRGLVKETNNLIKLKIPRRRIMELGFEYRFPLLYLEGAISKDEMLKRIKTETWHYVKRQMTYFKKVENIHWISNIKDIENLVIISPDN